MTKTTYFSNARTSARELPIHIIGFREVKSLLEIRLGSPGESSCFACTSGRSKGKGEIPRLCQTDFQDYAKASYKLKSIETFESLLYTELRYHIIW